MFEHINKAEAPNKQCAECLYWGAYGYMGSIAPDDCQSPLWCPNPAYGKYPKQQERAKEFAHLLED